MSERIQVSLQRRLRRCLRQAFEATATATAVARRSRVARRAWPGWVGGGRRKPVLGGLAAASMPRTPPPTHPDQAHSTSRRRTARALGFQVERGVRSVFLRKTDLTPEAMQLLLLLFLLQSGVDAHGNCPWPGGWVAQGRKRHGWRARAYRDVFTAPPAPPTHPANLQKAAVRGKPQPRGAPPMAADRAQRLFPPESSNHALAHGLTTQLMTTLSPPGAGLSPRPPRYPVRPLRRLPGRRPDLRHARRHRGPRAL